MSSRLIALIGAAVLTFAMPVTAQIEDTGLSQVDPWGIGFLTRGEPALPTNMWRASHTEDLLPMMRRVRTRGLTPAERTLMRRMALSPAEKPRGEKSPDLLAERARIMFELGEARAAASLMGRLTDQPEGLNGEEVSADLNLALGQEATACAPTTGALPDGAFWLRLRAVCAALRGNTSGAELAIEMAEGQGVRDKWLFDAIFAASGDVPQPPMGRFDSGLRLAISAKAGLKAPVNAVRLQRPDLAAAMARRANLSPALRVQAAGVAAEAGLIETSVYRSAFVALLESEDFKPSNSLEMAMKSANDPEKTSAEIARSLAIALKSTMGSPAKFTAVSRLLAPDIARLPRNSDTAAHALLFARAGLAAGNGEAAGRWTTALTFEGAPEVDPYENAFLEGLIILSGADTSQASIDYISERLITQAKTPDQMARTTRIFGLWTLLGHVPPAQARGYLTKQQSDHTVQLLPTQLLALQSAAQAGAAGEVILITVDATNGDPSKLDVVTLAFILDALGEIGAEDAARDLALEATGYWAVRRK